jgi:protein-disulfide isomerase
MIVLEAPHDANTQTTTVTPTTKLSWLTQANVTTAMAVSAFILAAAPYVVPQIQTFQVSRGLKPQILETAIKDYQGYQQDKAAEAQKIADKNMKTYLQQNQSVLRFDNSDPAIGNRNAPIKVYAFIDYNCSVCRAVDPRVLALMKQNPDAVLVVKEFPVITEISPLIAAYALGAHEVGQFEAAHKALFSSKIHTEADIVAALKGAGLNAEAIRKRAFSPAIRAKLDATIKVGEQLQLSGTPAYIINDTLIPGGDLNQIKTVIAAQRAKNNKT